MNDSPPSAADGATVDWSTEAIVARRDRYFAATQRKFVPYQTPQVFRRGAGPYRWDEDGRRRKTCGVW